MSMRAFRIRAVGHAYLKSNPRLMRRSWRVAVEALVGLCVEPLVSLRIYAQQLNFIEMMNLIV